MFRIATIVGAVAALASSMPAHAQLQSPSQPTPPPPMQQGKNNFCLKQSSGVLTCTYQTLAQCQIAANSTSSGGSCVPNPSATTGSGTRN